MDSFVDRRWVLTIEHTSTLILDRLHSIFIGCFQASPNRRCLHPFAASFLRRRNVFQTTTFSIQSCVLRSRNDPALFGILGACQRVRGMRPPIHAFVLSDGLGDRGRNLPVLHFLQSGLDP